MELPHGGSEAEAYDLVVLGTGLPEAVLAAAAARAGRSVLQLDAAPAYGGACASAPGGLAAALAALRAPPAAPTPPAALSIATSKFYAVRDRAATLRAGGGAGLEALKAPAARLGPGRAYALDLAGPKAVLGAGKAVAALVASQAHRYVEFQPLMHSYAFRPDPDAPRADGDGAAGVTGTLVNLPASQAAIFQERSIPLKDKRVLTRFLKAMLAEAEAADGGDAEAATTFDGTFGEYLAAKGLPRHLADDVLYALALADGDQAARPLGAAAGLAALRRYVASVGRFGPGQVSRSRLPPRPRAD